MTDRFERAFEKFAIHEGGYVDHPRDPGGRTMKGITQATYNAHRARQGLPEKHVKQITDREVYDILRVQYWEKVSADDLPEGVAYCVADAAVNSGPAQAAKWLQRVVGVPDDGIVGEKTIDAAHHMPPDTIIREYCARRLAFMKRLAHWPSFGKGWSRRVQEVQDQSLPWAASRPVAKSEEVEVPKASGEKSIGAIAHDMVTDRGSLGAAGGILGSLGSIASGDGPIQYALAVVFVLGALAAIWWLVKGRET